MESFWKDDTGMIRLHWILLGLIPGSIILLAAIMAFVAPITYVFSEKACREAGDLYQRDTDYRFWSNTCYIELDDGTSVALDKYRLIIDEHKE